MKAALEAWGSNSNLFHQGAAKETHDPEIVAPTLAKPGVVLRRAVGSSGPLTEHAALPTDLAGEDASGLRNALDECLRSGRRVAVVQGRRSRVKSAAFRT